MAFSRKYSTRTSLLHSIALSAFFVATAFAQSGPRPRPTPTPDPSTEPDGKGTIGMVCIDGAGNQVTWLQSGAQKGFAFENCVRSILNRASEPTVIQGLQQYREVSREFRR